ncbi:putative ribonuclease H-like domain-containing protein [Tanacetum coccineum]
MDNLAYGPTRRSIAKFHKMDLMQKRCGMPSNLDLVEMTNPRRCRSVSTEDANQKFLRSLPSAWSFKCDGNKALLASSSSRKLFAFVSENTRIHKMLYSYCVSNPFLVKTHSINKPSSYLLLANQSSFPQLDHEDLEQIDEYDLKEMDLKTGHFARECRIKGNQDNRRRDAWNSGTKDGSRIGQKENSKALVTIDGEGVDWTNHSEDDDFALMACNRQSQYHSRLPDENLYYLKSLDSNTIYQKISRLNIHAGYNNKGTEDKSSCKVQKTMIVLLRDSEKVDDSAQGCFVTLTIWPLLCLHNLLFKDCMNKIGRTDSNLSRAVKLVSKLNKVLKRAHAFVSYVQKQRRNNHKDFQHCLFACFLSQDEPQDEFFRSLKDGKLELMLCPRRIAAVYSAVQDSESLDSCRFALWEDGNWNKMARIEAISIFLAFASYMGFIVYQMDVKSAFLYGKIDEEVYVSQPLEILKKFDFVSVKTASTPIETQKPLVKDEEATDMDVHLYRSMIGSLMYLTASRPDIMFAVCACSRFQVTPKTSHLNAMKRIFRYLKGKPKLGLRYPRVSSFDLEAYSDSDYAGANLDRKSTTGGCQFLGRRLISWQCKKQTIVAISTTKAEYVAAANCCGQVLWIQNQMLDYGFNFMNTKIYIDNESTICIVKNLVFHSKTKHIEIRHHFIRDAYEKKLIQVLKIHTDDNVADLLTKAFDVSRESLRRVIDGTKALLLLTLFILWLDTVSTNSAKLVPLGKVCTAIETLKKNTAKALISLLTTIALTTTMAVLDSCPKHNMVAYLEKTKGNAEFHKIIDFLTRNSIHHALTVSPIVSTTFVKQFWTSAKSKIINNVRHITAKVAGKLVSISEASIRSDLLFDDADGIDSLPNQAIFDAI